MNGGIKGNEKAKMQNPHFKFLQNLFQSSNFAFIYFSALSFRFIQLRFSIKFC